MKILSLDLGAVTGGLTWLRGRGGAPVGPGKNAVSSEGFVVIETVGKLGLSRAPKLDAARCRRGSRANPHGRRRGPGSASARSPTCPAARRTTIVSSTLAN